MRCKEGESKGNGRYSCSSRVRYFSAGMTALVSYSFLLFFIRVGGGEGTPRLFRIISPLMLLDQFGANPHSLLGVGS